MKTVDALRAIGVVNTHDLLRRFADKGKDVACCFYAGETRGFCHRTHVYSPSHSTDPGAHWGDHGNKAFWGPRAETMPKAVAWASERYGVDEWAPDPTSPGDRVPKVVRDRALAAVREAKRRGSPQA